MPTMDSGPDEIYVSECVDAVLKLFPSLNDPNFKEYLEQFFGHPSYRLAHQQMIYLLSETENEALKYDQHAFSIALEEIRKTIKASRKCPPLPEDCFAIIKDHHRALKKKVADEGPAAVTSYTSDKNFLLDLCKALVTMKKIEDEADESGDEEDVLILHKNAAWGNVEGLNDALQGGADMEEKDTTGRTALEVACAFGKVESAEFLIKSGVDVNWSDNNGDIALHYAVLHGRLQCVELLLKHGASLTHKNNAGLNPIEWATKYQSRHHDEILEMFNKHLAAAQPSYI